MYISTWSARKKLSGKALALCCILLGYMGHANGQTLQGWTRNVYAKGDVSLADVVINFLKDQPVR